MRESEVK